MFQFVQIIHVLFNIGQEATLIFHVLISFIFYWAADAPGIFARTPVRSTPVMAWTAGGS